MAFQDPHALAAASQQEGLQFAHQAISSDSDGRLGDAIIFYTEAVNALARACSLDPSLSPHLMPHLQRYNDRAAQLRQQQARERQRAIRRQRSTEEVFDKGVLRQLEYQLEQACVEDEKGHLDAAMGMYSRAVEAALQDLKKVSDPMVATALKKRVKLGLDRLEQIKSAKGARKARNSEGSLDLPAPPTFNPEERAATKSGSFEPDLDERLRDALRLRPLTSFLDTKDDLSAPFGAKLNPPPPQGGGAGKKPSGGSGGGGTFTEKEKKILEYTGFVNGKRYLPWQDSDVDELKQVTKLPGTYKDPDGLPALADKQKAQLQGWVRPDDICDDPKMIKMVSSMAIKQTLIGDCSFVASLAICADYERKFQERLVTSIVFPQNRHGLPVMNPCGKYLVKLHINGCRRKVVLDDRLPLGDSGELLCSFSQNEDEFWVSLIEKAYMKVMGGYDFPGSSSNIDLHALTGWIPERVELKNRDEGALTALYRQLEHTLKLGNALITVATGDLSATDKERSGLVTLHAYAVLEVKEVLGNHLLQLKNPWSHQRWKGNFSEKDDHWTPELRSALHFDQMQAIREDNGVFWIDWKSVCRFFDVVYINWKPKLFEHKSTIHDLWEPAKEEYKDQYVYKISTNPQYRLIVKSSKQARVWILLSRHITDKDDFAHNRKFICVHVANGKGVCRTHQPGDYILTGIKINTPHYLAKLDVVPAGVQHYNLIVSQLMEEMGRLYYTLKVYSTAPFSLEPVKEPYSHRKKVSDRWAGPTAGGCRMYPTFNNNPRYRLVLEPVGSPSCRLQLQLETKVNEGVGLVIVAESPTTGEGFKEHSTQTFRPHYVVEELSSIPPGAYYITPATFKPKEAIFSLTVSTDCVFSLDKVH